MDMVNKAILIVQNVHYHGLNTKLVRFCVCTFVRVITGNQLEYFSIFSFLLSGF